MHILHFLFRIFTNNTLFYICIIYIIYSRIMSCIPYMFVLLLVIACRSHADIEFDIDRFETGNDEVQYKLLCDLADTEEALNTGPHDKDYYDDEIGMLKNYKGHPVRNSLRYALALLDIYRPQPDEKYYQKLHILGFHSEHQILERAKKIIFTSLNYQCTGWEENKCTDNHGISLRNIRYNYYYTTDICYNYATWPDYIEDFDCDSGRLDRNNALFCGIIIIQILSDHRDKFTDSEINIILSTLDRIAYRTVIRNETIEWTNVAFMDICLTYIAGLHLDNHEYMNYAVDKLDLLYRYTQKRNGFQEFNSPVYSLVSLDTAGLMMIYMASHLENSSTRKIAYLYDMIWRDIIVYYHCGMHVNVGPKSRSTDIEVTSLAYRKGLRLLLFRNGITCGNQPMVHFGSNILLKAGETGTSYRIMHKPPGRYHSIDEGSTKRIITIQKPTQLIDNSGRNIDSIGDFRNVSPLKLYTYSNNKYAISSINHYPLRIDSRPLVVYVKGNTDNNSLASIHPEIYYKNSDSGNYEFMDSNAILFSKQNDNIAYCIIVFSLDYRDKRISNMPLDEIRIVFRCHDYRSRIYARRNKQRVMYTVGEKPDDSDAVHVHIMHIGSQIGNYNGKWSSDKGGYDIVIKSTDGHSMLITDDPAYAAFAIEVTDNVSSNIGDINCELYEHDDGLLYIYIYKINDDMRSNVIQAVAKPDIHNRMIWNQVPVELEGVLDRGKAVLTWDDNIYCNKGFLVERKNENGEAFNLLSIVETGDEIVENMSYIDDSIDNDIAYIYRIVPVFKSNGIEINGVSSNYVKIEKEK